MMGYKIMATDGELGKATDFYFDDHTWMIRYLVVDTGHWLAGRQVLISPAAVGTPRHDDRHLPVSLTMDQVRNSPGVQTDLPVSRQEEAELVTYYGWAQYWQPVNTELDVSPGMPPVPFPRKSTTGETSHYDPRLRSAREVIGYHIKSSDGSVGHVSDFLAATDGWIIRYLVVDTRNWLPGRKVLLAPSWIKGVDWLDQKVDVSLDRQTIKSSPEYDHSMPPDRQYEEALHDFYGKPGYWKKTKGRN